MTNESREHAASVNANPLPGKNPSLLRTTSLTPDDFEDFTERLLSAHRFCAPPLRHIVRVERWGRKGDKQNGIDFEGTWSDGKSAAWQCKRYDRLSAQDVRDAVNACTFEADEYYLTYSGEASSDARAEIALHSKWQLIDQRGLGRLVDDLPLHRRREVLDATWGVQVRKLLLEVPGEDAFISLESFASNRTDTNSLINDCHPLIGREEELRQISAGLNPSEEWPPVVLLTGPGGRGKTRLLIEALRSAEQTNPQTQVLFLAPGRSIDQEALRELPHVPAIIVVDDAHRDPSVIPPLLNFVMRTATSQLVVSSRGSASDHLREQFVVNNLRHVEVGLQPLRLADSRKLVSALSTDISISAPLAEHLARQAVDNPHVAVLAVNLARGGALESGAFALDGNLRDQIMIRYQEALIGDVRNFSSETVKRVLATYTALGPIDTNDRTLRKELAEFCNLSLANLLRLEELLEQRDVLLTRSGKMRVTPDLFADQVLERESVIRGVDTGFAREIWSKFGSGSCGVRLVITLSELDWRLRHHGGPSVIYPVWDAVQEELDHADLAGLHIALGRLEPLTYTQSKLLLDTLEKVRDRLKGPVAQNDSPAHSSGLTAQRETSWLSMALRQPSLTVQDVATRLPRLYGQCARHAPETLEAALDALWDLRRRDARAPNSYPDHPERIITDLLANLGSLADPSFPERIVERVRFWLAETSLPTDL